MADGNCIRTCRYCGNCFQKSGAAKYALFCSLACRAQAKRERRKARGYRPNRLVTLTCVGCRSEYETRHKEQRFCSKKCAFASKRPPIVVVTHHGACAVCGARHHGPRPKKFCSRGCEKAAAAFAVRAAHQPRACATCGNQYTPAFGMGRPSVFCSSECQTATKVAQRQAGRAARKARIRGAGQAESIDPIRVFERDRWRCRLCGVLTPRSLRGTCDPRAPELDHIVALALGGTHTWGNVQCACRKCNGSKGAAALGQLVMPFAA